MSNGKFYPEIHRGTEIEWASSPGAGDAQWILGRVAITKTESCDVELAGSGVRRDCLHVDDPRCEATRDWAQAGRGVFRLTRGELERREMFGKTIPAIKRKLFHIEQFIENGIFKTDPRAKLPQGAGGADDLDI